LLVLTSVYLSVVGAAVFVAPDQTRWQSR